MATPTTTALPIYDYHEKAVVQGAVLAFYGAVGPGNAEPTGGWKPAGIMEPDGIEYNEKTTFGEIKTSQLTRAIEAFYTSEESDVKLTLAHMDSEITRIARGKRSASLVTVAATSAFGQEKQMLGEPAGIGAGGVLATGTEEPDYRANYYQWLFLWPSTGFDNSTPATFSNPRAKWACLRFYKAYCHSAGAAKYGPGKHATLSFSIRALEDMSVSGADKVGELINFLPKTA